MANEINTSRPDSDYEISGNYDCLECGQSLCKQEYEDNDGLCDSCACEDE